MIDLPTVDVEAKISRESIVQLVLGLCIVVAIIFTMINLTNLSKK